MDRDKEEYNVKRGRMNEKQEQRERWKEKERMEKKK